jgi:hypothetical protein
MWAVHTSLVFSFWAGSCLHRSPAQVVVSRPVLHHLLPATCLQVFGRSTSLAEVYSALVEDGQAGDTQALLAAASAAAGYPITLPHITHAAGFDKYRSLGAGEAAHEAGYDAYMTGAAFACLLPLVAGKIAAEPSSALAQAHSAAIERAAAAAAAKAARAASMATPEVGALQQQTPPLSPMLQQLQPTPQQQQQLLAEQQATPQLQQQTPQVQQLQPSSLLQFVQGIAGRLNITFSDIAYAALSEDDPVPERPTTFCLSGLQPGYRLDDVWRMLQRQGLGSVSDMLFDSAGRHASWKLAALKHHPALRQSVAAWAGCGVESRQHTVAGWACKLYVSYVLLTSSCVVLLSSLYGLLGLLPLQATNCQHHAEAAGCLSAAVCSACIQSQIQSSAASASSRAHSMSIHD